MDEDLSIINSNTRNDKIKNFFINNKYKIISGVIIFIIIIITVFSYDKYAINKKKEISENFNSITIDYSDNKKKITAERLIEIINKKDPTYSPLSLYFIIDNNLINNQEKVNSLFDLLIDETSLKAEIKNLIIYKKALFNADNAEESVMLNILNPIINSESVWKSHALYLMAEYFYSKNQKQKATEFFNQILNLENSNPDIRLQTEKRLNRDLSE
jgi:predicted negative regulator of RcsB-dependent stress response